jgi:hypothetical protein
MKSCRRAHQRRNEWMKNPLQTHNRNVRNFTCMLHAFVLMFLISMCICNCLMSVHLSISALFCVHRIWGLTFHSSPQCDFRSTFPRRLYSYANSFHEIVFREYRNAISEMVTSLVRPLQRESPDVLYELHLCR